MCEVNLTLCSKKNKTINTSIYSKHLAKTTLWMLQIVCVFSFWQIESTFCLFIDLFTYYDLVKYTLILMKWSLPLIWCSEAVTLLFTSQKWGSRRRRAAPVWILLLFCQQIHKKYGRWACVYQKRSRAVQRPLIIACYHSVLEMSHCGSDDSRRLGYLNTDGGDYAQTQLHAATMLRAAVICSGDVAAPASLG